MASSNDIAVVLCHGSYHSPKPYGRLLDAFKGVGMDAYCPHLPTADLSKLNVGDVNQPDFDREPPAGGYPQGDEDTQAVLSILEPLVLKEGKKVLLVAHSSGGWVATQAARPELQFKARNANGQPGGIVGILYMGAFVIPVGESIHSFFQPKDGTAVVPPFMEFHKHGISGLGTMVKPEKFLFNDMDQNEAKEWATTLTASPILTTKLTNDAYSALPCGYLVLEGDMTLPKEYQEGMAAMQAEKTGEFSIYRCRAGHSPHLSWTQGVVETAQEFLSKKCTV
ncbi:alpha/beta-hydrolase [Apiospora kogelbergensis]|uniref:Alpha/beta-hydrolase n=1 Tax=Apiospora kogelbergensis TaxID=1337665 RepID=A0AAW0RBM4_9PEZI